MSTPKKNRTVVARSPRRLTTRFVVAAAFVCGLSVACDVHSPTGLGSLASIAVTPDVTLPIFGTQQFVAVGKDADGNVLPLVFTWSVIAGGGAIDAAGFFTAGAVPGLYGATVKAASSGMWGTATVTVTAGPLATITVTPNPDTLAINGSQQFVAVGKDAGGNVVPVTPTWSVVAGGGTINSGSGLFTAGTTPGTYANTVAATQGSVAGHATVVVTVGPLVTITVTPNPDTLHINATQQFVAVGKDAGGNVVPVTPTWSVVAGGGTISSGAGLFTAGTTPGTFANTVTATQGSVAGHATVTVIPAAQTITFAQPTTPAVHGSTFAIAPTATSGLPVTVTPSGGCTVAGGMVTMTSGTVACVLTASQAGDVSYTAAPPVARTVAAALLAASVTPAAAGKLFGAADPALTGTLTGFLVGDAVTAAYSRTAGEAVGTYPISATLSPAAALGNYSITHNAAAFTIGQAAQAITFVQPTTPATYGSSFAIAPTSSAALAVTVGASGGCSIAGGTVTMTSGTVACVLTASQAGDASYTPAASVVRTVGAGLLAASVTPAAAGKPFGGADPALTGTLAGFLPADAVTATYSRAAGEAVGAYPISGTPSAAGGAGILANYTITHNTAVFTIGQAAQAITFVQPTTPATYGSTFAIAPTANSLLPVTVGALGGCTLAGSTVTMTSGTVACVLTASQAGNASYAAASDVVRTVAASMVAASVSPTAAGKLFGAADPALTGTLAGFLPADAVTATYSRALGEAIGTYPISGTPIAAGGASVLANYTISHNTAVFTIGQATQIITFVQPTTPATYGSTFAIAPTATSALTVLVTPSGGCTLAGSTVTMTSGTVACVLTASQAGDASYTAATSVVRTVAAALLAASVTPAAAGKLFGAADPVPLTTGTLTGFLPADAVAASYSRVAGEAVGSYTISATLSPAGVLGNYAITSNTAAFTITQAAQAITFAQPTSPATYGGTFVIAPTSSAGLTVTVGASGGCSIAGGTVTMTSGTVACVLTASQAGDASYTAATSVVRTVAAALLAASVTPAAAGKLFGAADPVPLTTGTLTGFLPADAVTATYSRAAGEAVGSYTISGTPSAAGGASVLANYAIAHNTALFTIGQAAQAITFAQPATPATYGSSFAIAPTSSAGLTVTVGASGGCSIAGGTVTMTSGTVACVLTASQAGDASFTAATSVVRTVLASLLSASVTPAAASKLFGAADPIPLTTGTLTGFLPADAVAASYSRVTGEAVGTYTINATLSPAAVLGNYGITHNTALFTIGQAAQAITFAQPTTPATYGSTFAIAPTATSSLTVLVTPSGGCTLSGSTVTMTSGTTACVLTASQAGDASYTAASDVVRTVVAALKAASVAPTAAGKVYGTVDPALTGTLTGFLPADAVTASYSRVAGEAVGTYTISATLSPAGPLSNYAITSSTAAFTITQAAQAITFAQPTTPATYGSTFAIAPTASSALAVTVGAAGGCSIAGGTVTMTSGTVACVLTASQAGDASYTAATSVVRTVAASLLAASVTPAAAGKAFGTSDPVPVTTGTLAGFLPADGVTASYSRTAGEAVGGYTISATLSPAGVLGNYAITSNTAAFTITQAAQAITFAQPTTPATYGSTFAIAPTASSALAVTVGAAGGCSIAGGTVTMTSGTVACVLTASQAGDVSYTAATSVVRTVAAGLLAASVTPAVAGKVYGTVDPALTGTLTGFLPADAVTATYIRAAGEAVGGYPISGTPSAAGGASVLANYTITTNTAVFTITQAAQAITFAQPTTPATYGSSFAIAPTSSSALTVAVAASGGCTLSGGTVTMTSGTVACVLTASQAGDASYSAASDVVRTVSAGLLAASVTPAVAGKVYGTVDPALTGTLTGFLPADAVTATYSRTSGEAVGGYIISGTPSAAGGVLANYTITSNTAAFTITQAAQSITFGALSTKTYGDASFTVGATGGASGNAVTFAAAPAGVCTVSGTAVTIVGAGICSVTASQAGNTNYTAAADVAQPFTVATLAASVTPDSASKVFGGADPTFTGTLTGFLPADGVTAVYSRTAGSSLGTYTISAVLSATGALANYTITYDTATFTVGLGRAAPFAVLGSTAVSCAAVSTLYGNLGVDPSGAISGFPSPCVISAPGDGIIHLNDAAAAAAQADVTSAYGALAAMPCTADLTGQDLGGKNLTPGVYCFSTSAQLTGTLTLTGSATDVWVFQIGSTLTTAAGSIITLSGAAKAGNVYWQVGSTATLGAGNAPFQGSIIALTSIGLGAGTSLTGRALARNGAVTLDTDIITLPLP